MLDEAIRNVHKNKSIDFHWLMLLVNWRIYKMALNEDDRTKERDNTQLYLYISNRSKSQEQTEFNLQTLLQMSLIPWFLMWKK